MKEWTTIDKAEKWGDGEWVKEPDKVQWIDDATGFDCLMHRHPTSGHWCGYVGVAEGHPCFNRGYDDVCVDIHGGLTYSEFCVETGDESKGVCHVPEEGRPHKVWWFGFDCAHSGDLTPISLKYKDGAFFSLAYERYRSREWVATETARLATQMVTATPTERDE